MADTKFTTAKYDQISRTNEALISALEWIVFQFDTLDVPVGGHSHAMESGINEARAALALARGDVT